LSLWQWLLKADRALATFTSNSVFYAIISA
jgi:hypothetical protein